MTVTTYGDNAVDRKSKKESANKNDICIKHTDNPDMADCKEGDEVTIKAIVTKQGKGETYLSPSSVEPKENSADKAMQAMMGKGGGPDKNSADSAMSHMSEQDGDF